MGRDHGSPGNFLDGAGRAGDEGSVGLGIAPGPVAIPFLEQENRVTWVTSGSGVRVLESTARPRESPARSQAKVAHERLLDAAPGGAS